MKIFKFIIFFRERIFLYRLYKFLRYYFSYNDFDFLIAIKYVLKNPIHKKKSSKESFYFQYRGYNSKNVTYLQELPFVWNDVYGIGVRIEHVLDNDIKIDIEYLKVWANLLFCFLEDRSKFSNNHFLMNILILKRLSNNINLTFEKELDFLLEKSFKYVFKANFFEERSSNYLFLIGHRLILSSFKNLQFDKCGIFEKIIIYYLKMFKYAENTTWIGDISPDKINFNKIKSNKLYNEINNKSDIINFGSFIFGYSPNFILKISIDNSLVRHGHEDYGSVVFNSDKLNIFDMGIDDLSNQELKKNKNHYSFKFGKFKTILKNDNFNILFENCSINMDLNNLKFIYDNVTHLNFLSNSFFLDDKNCFFLNKEFKIYQLNSSTKAKLIKYKINNKVLNIYNG